MKLRTLGLVVVTLVIGISGFGQTGNIISYIVDPRVQNLQFYWKDDSGRVLGSIQNLQKYVEGKHQQLVFAMNGGMFRSDGTPVGLYIQQKSMLAPLDTSSGAGNFYLKPNGVLYVTKDNKAVICSTADFRDDGNIRFATQSGPMLLINGGFHPAFKKASPNVNIRNAVGLLPDNTLVFAMSKEPINFYELAEYFKSLGCQNALYLDGFVSRTFLPEKSWVQMDGNFGVIIGVTR
jgi:uncharacterized protein YigE (DUF2233 family)